MTRPKGYHEINKYTLIEVDEDGILHAIGPRRAHRLFHALISRKYRRCVQCGGRIDRGDPTWRPDMEDSRDRICEPCVQLVPGYRRPDAAHPHKPADRLLHKYPLVDYAYTELDIAGMLIQGEEESIGACVLGMIEVLARHHHAQDHLELVLKLFWDLAHRRPLSGLTSEPGEWEDLSSRAGKPLWRNRRDSEAFSEDEGRTFYRTSDPVKRRVKSLQLGGINEQSRIDEEHARNGDHGGG